VSRARWALFAYHTFGARALEALLARDEQVVAVVTHADDPSEGDWFDSVADVARTHRLPLFTPASPNLPVIVETLRALEPDVILSVWYRRLLGADLLAVPRIAALNLHGSLLPKYRGRVPVNWAVLKGETETGATLHEMTAKPDAGRIVDQEAVTIGPDDLAVDVFRKVTGAAERVLRRSLPRLLDGSAVLRAQDLARGSYFGGRKPEDGRIDWSRGAREIHNLVRAVAPPYPGAFFDLGGRRLFVHRTRLAARPGAGPARPLLQAAPGAAFVAARCADGATLELTELVLDGTPLNAPQFAARFGADPIALPVTSSIPTEAKP